ncbi:hypothetical protein BGK67_34705 (plasmid) [Streptomyces subrutilus]|uniref:Uncharacterized protein n=1 Tax=Streptomyces subrutilus TaxID=36818 RepID=A0A1E5NXR0_9ACTN|nr:hypothetical protein BGK67_34705 [Streptomyces subrutilus]
MPAVADALAALLPARRNRPWTTAPAEHAMRHGAPCVRLTDGVRALLVVEPDDTRLEVYVERPDDYASHADIVADAVDPAGAAPHIAGRLLRWVLPELDRATSAAIARADGGFHKVHQHRAQDMTELGYALIDAGAHPEVADGYCGPGLVWSAAQGGTWGVRTVHGTVVADYVGPLGGLHGVLPLVLPPADGHVPTDTGSVFTRHLTDRYPQLSPVTAHEVSLNGYQEPGGYVALPNHAVSPDCADDQTQVVAEFSHLGADLLLTAVPHLI